jgi:hypothetical protein
MSLNHTTPHDTPPAGYPPLPYPMPAYGGPPQAMPLPLPPSPPPLPLRAPTPPQPPVPPPTRSEARPKSKESHDRSATRFAGKPQLQAFPAPQPKSSPSLVARPVGATDDAASLAAAEREELEARQRAIIAGAASMIVHLVILITLGLMGSAPKTDTRGGIVLEASVAKLDDLLHSEAARIDLMKPETIDAGRPVGMPDPVVFPPQLHPQPNLTYGGLQPPKYFGPPTGTGGPGADMPPGEGPAHTKPGDGNGATFFDIPATGRKIAFVVDTSGSMFDNERYLRCRSELIESLRTLKPKQYYYIVLFSDRLFPMPGRRLTEATPGNLYRTIAWLNGADPTGTTEPLPALRQALQQRPDAIFLLTDGSFEDGTLEKILKLQTSSKKVPIHTIAFEGQDGEETLQAISRATGGKYRYVK